MIITRTPYRISFFGGGTDYPDYYMEHGGKVLGVAIDKYSYLNVRQLPPFFSHKHRIVYSKIENVNELDEIVHPSVRETLRYFKIDHGVSIHHDGDIPARSGMGSSSAFTVGLIKSLMALDGRIVSNHDLAMTAMHIEQNLIKENVGSQDQIFAAYGGLNLIDFLQTGEVIVHPVIVKPVRIRSLESSLMLFFTGISRYSSEIASEQVKNTAQNLCNLHAMKKLVDDAYEILVNPGRDLDEFGELLNETWLMKKTLSSKISNPAVDEMYERAIRAGAIGGKLLGAGGGGLWPFTRNLISMIGSGAS